MWKTASATEKYSLSACGRVMVKMRGKSSHPAVVILREGKPWELKDQINRSLRAARSISEGRLLDPFGDERAR